MSSISAGTSAGTALVQTGDTSGTLQLQVNGTTPSVTLAANGAIGVGSSPAYGTTGQVLTSGGSGSAPSWATPSSVTYRNITTTTADITLTSSDGGAFLTVTSTANVNINLPAANALTGSRTIVIKNIGAFAMLVYDNAGNYLFPLAPNYGVTCWASVATTAAGTWTVSELPPNFVSPSVDIGSSTNIGAYTKQSTSPLSSTELLITYSTGTTMYATIATNSSGVLTFSTPQSLGTGGSHPAVMALSSTLAVVNYVDASANLYAVAMTISGTTFTVGTPVLIASAIYGNQMFSMLSATKAALVWNQGIYQILTRLFSISGTTITTGATVTITNNGSNMQFGTCGVTATMYAITWYDSGNGIKIVQCNNNSALVVSVATPSSVFSGGDFQCGSPVVCKDSSSVLCIYQDATTNYLVGRILNVSGTNWSFATQYNILNTSNNLFRYEICASSSSSFVVAYTDGIPAPLKLRGITVSGSTITTGSQYTASAGITQNWYTPWNLQPFQSPSVQPASSSFVTLYVPQSGLYEQAIGVSGTTLTTSYSAYPVSTSASLVSFSNAYSTVAAFSSTRAAVFGVETGNDGYSVLTAYLIDYSTTTPTYLSKVTVGNASANVYMCATQLTSTTVVVTYRTPTNTIVGNVITMSGTSLSTGAQATINSTTTCEYNSVSALSSSTLIAYYRKSSSLQIANVLTVSGTSISVGADTTVSTSDLNYHCVDGLSATSAIVTNGSNARILTISGTSVSAVSANQYVYISAGQFGVMSPISATQVLFAGVETSGASSFIKATVLTISGTTISLNPVASTSELAGVSMVVPVMFNAYRGMIFFPVCDMSLPFTVSDNLVTLGNLQSTPCQGGANVLGPVSIATPNYQKAATYAANQAGTTTISRQVFSLGAAN